MEIEFLFTVIRGALGSETMGIKTEREGRRQSRSILVSDS